MVITPFMNNLFLLLFYKHVKKNITCGYIEITLQVFEIELYVVLPVYIIFIYHRPDTTILSYLMLTQ